MALVPVTHKPVNGTARQFDGTLTALTDILSGRPNANIQVNCQFNAAGAFVSITISGGAWGNVRAGLNDWVVFPTDSTLQPLSVTAAEASANWQLV